MTHGLRDERVEHLLRVQHAARAVSDSPATWWLHLNEAAEAAITADTLDSCCHLILEAIQPVLGADEVSILVTDASQDALITRTSVGLGEDATVPLHIPAGEGMAGRVLASKASLVVDDLTTIKLVSPTLQDMGLKSVAAVPLLGEGRVLGVLHAGSREPAHFSGADAELLELLAERLAPVLERVRLIEEQRRIANISNFLAETARIMAGATDLVSTLNELAKAALPAMGDVCLIDIVDEDGQIDRVVAQHVDPARQPLADRLRLEFAPATNGSHPAAEVLELGASRWSPTMSEEFLRATTHNEDHYQLTQSLGFRAYVAVPISTELETIGVLTLVSCSRPFIEDDVALAEGLAQQVGTIVAKAQQLDQAMSTSRILQAALLPDAPSSLPGLTLCTSYVASSTALDVGGDFYDVMALPGGPVWIAIGDVEGHDQRAAAEMGQLRSAVRTLAIREQTPELVVDELRRSWDLLGLTRTATVLIGKLDPETGELVVACAGHPPPLLVGSSGAEYLSVPPNTLLGIGSRKSAVAHTTSLGRGDALLLYTDGALMERTSGMHAALARLQRVALSGDRSPKQICRRIIDAVQESDDDTALLAVRWEAPSSVIDALRPISGRR